MWTLSGFSDEIARDLEEQCALVPELGMTHLESVAPAAPNLEYVQIKDAQLATGEVVAAGRGDGEVVETIRALRQEGYDGFFSLEPHLSQTHSLGGFSGPDLFTEAWQAFTDLLKAEDIPYQ